MEIKDANTLQKTLNARYTQDKEASDKSFACINLATLARFKKHD